MTRLASVLLLCCLLFPAGASAMTLDALVNWYNDAVAKEMPLEARIAGLTEVIDDPASDAATASFALGLRARARLDSGDPDGGLADAGAAVAKDDTVHEAHHAFGRALEAFGEHARAAEAYARAADLVKNREWKALYQRQAEAMEALAVLDAFTEREKEYHAGKMRYQEFLALCDEAMVKTARHKLLLAYFQSRRAGAHLTAGNLNKAKADALAAIAVNDRFFEGHRVLSCVYEQEGNQAEALASAEKAASMAPDALKEEMERHLARLRQE